MFKFLFRIAALVGIGYAATKLSKKENRDRVASEYNKAKEDPKKYAQDVQEKVTESAQEYQEKAKSEYYKAKDDPKGYSEDLQSKAKEYTEDLQSKAKDEFGKLKTNAEEKFQDITKKSEDDSDTDAQEARFDDETPAKTDINEVEDADFENNVLRDYEETEEEILERTKDDHKTVITKKDKK